MDSKPSYISNSFYSALLSRKGEIEDKYRRMTGASAALFEKSLRVLPGGVTRDSVMRKPYPAFVASGSGSKLTDADGNELVDFWFNATSLPLGHCHPIVSDAARSQVARGTAFFAPGATEAELAEEILRRIKSAELVRFMNSGSEAVMFAVRLARGFKRRPLVAKFEGSYHGSYDDVAWSVGPRPSEFGPKDAPSAVPESIGLNPSNTVVLPYNDLAATTALLDSRRDELAAVLVEPVANRMGLILPDKGFIDGLAAYCRKHGIVLIFDEATAFRVGYHGAQVALRIEPDLTVLGKVIGGGFPVGAVAGKAEILAQMSTSHAVPHAGTFNGNPVTMEAGLATLRALTPDVFDTMNAMGADLRSRLSAAFSGLPLQVTGMGSLFKVSASHEPISDYRSAVTSAREWEELASIALWTEGCFLAPRLHGCVSAVTTQADQDQLVDSFTRVIGAHWRPS